MRFEEQCADRVRHRAMRGYGRAVQQSSGRRSLWPGVGWRASACRRCNDDVVITRQDSAGQHRADRLPSAPVLTPHQRRHDTAPLGSWIGRRRHARRIERKLTSADVDRAQEFGPPREWCGGPNRGITRLRAVRPCHAAPTRRYYVVTRNAPGVPRSLDGQRPAACTGKGHLRTARKPHHRPNERGSGWTGTV